MNNKQAGFTRFYVVCKYHNLVLVSFFEGVSELDLPAGKLFNLLKKL